MLWRRREIDGCGVFDSCVTLRVFFAKADAPTKYSGHENSNNNNTVVSHAYAVFFSSGTHFPYCNNIIVKKCVL